MSPVNPAPQPPSNLLPPYPTPSSQIPCDPCTQPAHPYPVLTPSNPPLPSRQVEEEDQEFVEEFLSKADPSILHYLVASGDDITSKQLRDDLMTLLIAGHETTAAVLTWTFHILADHPETVAKIRAEVDQVRRRLGVLK